mmetsp:Transcript_7092/g.20525  ORF Transcript_7092/g.20525 Transcript_7092/m.20525 type:complete len:255 (-) Transcript_7092:243-1007(-)
MPQHAAICESDLQSTARRRVRRGRRRCTSSSREGLSRKRMGRRGSRRRRRRRRRRSEVCEPECGKRSRWLWPIRTCLCLHLCRSTVENWRFLTPDVLIPVLLVLHPSLQGELLSCSLRLFLLGGFGLEQLPVPLLPLLGLVDDAVKLVHHMQELLHWRYSADLEDLHGGDGRKGQAVDVHSLRVLKHPSDGALLVHAAGQQSLLRPCLGESHADHGLESLRVRKGLLHLIPEAHGPKDLAAASDSPELELEGLG